MHRSDYILIAEVLRDTRPKAKTIGKWSGEAQALASITHALIVGTIMEALRNDNPRFDENKFLHAVNDTPATDTATATATA